MKKIAVVNMSGHIGGNTDQFADYLAAHIQNAEVSLLKYSHTQNIHGCGRCHYECFLENGTCPYANDDVIRTYRLIADADFCYVILPNYGGGPCSNYFLFKERSQCVWQDGLWQRYADVPKHFLIFSNTDTEIFKQLLTNEVSLPSLLNISFFSSQDVNAKSTMGDLLDYPYFLEKLQQTIRADGFVIQ